MVFGVVYQFRNVRLLLFYEVFIIFLGYLYRDYERNINYMWDVRVDDVIEEIFIKIMIDIYKVFGFLCDDYLLVCVLKN